MYTAQKIYSSFSVDVLARAQPRYLSLQGLTVLKNEMKLKLVLQNSSHMCINQKANHQPTTKTVAHMVVTNNDETETELQNASLGIEQYHHITVPSDVPTDSNSCMRGQQ